jgi:hypothetical protein
MPSIESALNEIEVDESLTDLDLSVTRRLEEPVPRGWERLLLFAVPSGAGSPMPAGAAMER